MTRIFVKSIMRNILPANVATELDLNSGDSELLLVGYRSLLSEFLVSSNDSPHRNHYSRLELLMDPVLSARPAVIATYNSPYLT